MKTRWRVIACALMVPGALLTGCVDDEYSANDPRPTTGATDAGFGPKWSDIQPEPTCGDNILEYGESCEPGLWEPVACESPPYTGGMVQCLSDCRFSYAECEGGECRNGILEAGEACDTRGSDGYIACPEGADCPACTLDCQVVASPSCGNGMLELPEEECDGDVYLEVIQRAGGEVNLSRYDRETLICSRGCGVILTNAGPAECGNGIEEGGETCDPRGFRPDIRNSFDRRERCVDCTWQPEPGSCGDGELQPDFEQCDGNIFIDDRSTCESWVNAGARPEVSDRPVTCNTSCDVVWENCFGDNPDVPSDDDVQGGGNTDADDNTDAGENTEVGDNTDAAENTDVGVTPDAGSAAQPVEDENGCAVSSRRSVGANTLWSIAALLGLVVVNRRSGRLRNPAATR